MSRQGYFQPPSPVSPAFSTKMSPALRGRPFLMLDRASFARGSPDSPASPTCIRSPMYAGSPNILPLGPSIGRRGNDAMHCSRIVSSRASETGDSEDGWMVVRQQNITQTILASVAGASNPTISGSSEKPVNVPHAVEKTEMAGSRGPAWNETDFPPLKSPAMEFLNTSSQEAKIVTYVNLPMNQPTY